MLTLNLLGGLMCRARDGQEARFPTEKSRALLGYLALAAGRPQRRDQLATLFWPELSSSAARHNLRKEYFRLRQTLRPLLGDAVETVVIADRQVISMATTVVDLDVEAFARLRSQAAGISRPLASHPGAIAWLAEAAELYRGPLLDGIDLPDADPFEDWLLVQRQSLHQQALATLEALATAYEQRGEFSAARACAARQLAMEPWREEAHRQLMRAAALAGDRSAALAQFETCKTVLDEQLGVGPSVETIRLYRAIAAGTLAQPAAAEVPSPLNHFPATLTPFVGRQQELETVLTALQSPTTRLVTVMGPGGAGKTRLALQAARQAAEDGQFPDGLTFIPLASVTDPAAVATTIATALTLAPGQPGKIEPELEAYLAERNSLLLLDNLEHLTGAGRLLHRLLERAPRLRILATSRVALGVPGEQRIGLDGMTLVAAESVTSADAQRLFEQTAALLTPGFRPTADDRHAIDTICRQAHGMPLAIEMAAAWTRVMDCPAIAQAMAQNTEFLATPWQTGPARQQSMRAVFDYSWSLLDAPQRRALTACTVFSGSFTLEAALVVADTAVQPVAALLDHSLLRRTGDGRLRLHNLLRAYAAEHLPPAEKLAATERLASWAMSFLEARDAQLRGGRQLAALAEVGRDLDNIAVAWDWAVATGQTAVIDRLLPGVFHFCDMRSRYGDGAAWLRRALQQLGDGNQPALRARLQARLGWFTYHLGQPADAETLLRQSLDLPDGVPAARDRLFALNYLAAVVRHQQRVPEAIALVEEALAVAHAADDVHSVTIALNIRGQLALLQADHAAARDYCERALALKRAIGDRWGMTFSLTYLGRIALATGAYDMATAQLRESLAISEAFGDRRMIAFTLASLADVAAATGERAQLLDLLSRSLALYREIGGRFEASQVRQRLLDSESIT